MLARTIQWTFFLAVIGMALSFAGQAAAQSPYQYPTSFYNYYVGPGQGGVVAQLYVAPLPTPPPVGQTFITYEPLMPHNFLYKHARTYVRQHPNGQQTRTMVIWE